ncbi:MAG: NAD(P)H-dependent oxidoreductase [Candidatus Micrarchaeota archaeon]|nr:NAD(P)H-dependent oxidoreductase [Candidatus Micrarchaeota archaeon]
MEFEQIVKSRYATKKFDGKQVDEAKMQKLLELIRLAASSFNLQPWKIKVITDPALKEKLQAVSWNQPQITSCSHLLVFCADTDLMAHIRLIEAQMKAAGAPAESVEGFGKMLRGFEEGLQDERRLAWAQRQVYLALGNALNGAKSLGLDSCPMEGFDAKEYARILKLPEHLVPTTVCPVGYAADTPRTKMRLDEKEIFF